MSESVLRVLIGSHSHPLVLNGGSEVASHALFRRLARQPGVEAHYLGCSRDAAYARAGQTITQPFAANDYLYTVGETDWFKFANRDPAFAHDLRTLLAELRPDIVHLHHYVNFGVEVFRYVRETLPDAAIILTLHELLAICHNLGQMVKRPGGSLCRRSGEVECGRCFPEIQNSDFFLRRTYIQYFLRHVDWFIAPSAFLAERYAAWGLPEERIAVIENVPSRTAAGSDRRPRTGLGPLRVGFFGQISELKGMEVLLDAASILEESGRHDVAFAIHGDDSQQLPAFRTRFRERLETLSRSVTFSGPYLNEHVDGLMRQVDVVVVPSIWWENSPVVIQEALRNGCAIVCSNIGGMAEKVLDGESGLHFAVGNARALADTLARLAADPALLAVLQKGAASAGMSGHDPFEAHVDLYRRVLALHGRPRKVTAADAEPSTVPPGDLERYARRRRAASSIGRRAVPASSLPSLPSPSTTVPE